LTFCIFEIIQDKFRILPGMQNQCRPKICVRLEAVRKPGTSYWVRCLKVGNLGTSRWMRC